MGIRSPDRQPVAVVLSPSSPPTDLRQTQPEMIWALLEPEQQQTLFRTIVTICRNLVMSATPDRNRQEVKDEHA